jgi:TonB family protein
MKLRTGLLLLMAICVMSAGAGAAIKQEPQQAKVKVIHKVDPVYPEEAEREGVEGKVVLDVTVEQNGEVSMAKVLSGHKLLQQAAVDAVKQWRFANSVNDSVTIQLTISFSLSGSATEPQTREPALTNTHKVEAVYPEEAKRQHIQGQVAIEIKVNDKGEVVDARAVGGHDLLRQSAVDAAKQFRFSNNRHATVTATITFNFVLGK